MSARDELGKLLFTLPVSDRAADTAPEIMDRCDEAADAVLAAGYRKPRTILDYEELDTLPIGSVVLDRTGDVARRFSGGWRTTVVEPDGSAWLSGCMEDADLPATVLHEAAK